MRERGEEGERKKEVGERIRGRGRKKEKGKRNKKGLRRRRKRPWRFDRVKAILVHSFIHSFVFVREWFVLKNLSV